MAGHFPKDAICFISERVNIAEFELPHLFHDNGVSACSVFGRFCRILIGRTDIIIAQNYNSSIGAPRNLNRFQQREYKTEVKFNLKKLSISKFEKYACQNAVTMAIASSFNRNISNQIVSRNILGKVTKFEVHAFKGRVFLVGEGLNSPPSWC